MGQVTSLFARKLVAAAGDAIDPVAVLATVGLDANGPWDPKHMLDEDTFYGMLELMGTQMDVTALPLTVGGQMRPDEYGALGLAWKAAPNLLGSFSRVARYWRLWTSFTMYELTETPKASSSPNIARATDGWACAFPLRPIWPAAFRSRAKSLPNPSLR